MDDVTREIELDAEPQEVWDAVTSPDQLDEWFGTPDGTVAPGQVVRFTTTDGSVRRALIERMDEPRELAFRWLPSPTEPPSRVDITISPSGDGSVLRVREWRFEARLDGAHRSSRAGLVVR